VNDLSHDSHRYVCCWCWYRWYVWCCSLADPLLQFCKHHHRASTLKDPTMLRP